MRKEGVEVMMGCGGGEGVGGEKECDRQEVEISGKGRGN